MIELRNPLALLLLVLAPVVWYWYRRRRSPERPATALWLLRRGKGHYRRRRQIDLRLLALLAALTLLILALAGPGLKLAESEELIVVVDASASMAARDREGNSRLEAAKKRGQKLLAGADEAVLVRAGLEPRASGPAPGTALVTELEKLQAGDAYADLEEAVALGRGLLPGAPVLVVSDAEPPANADGYLNVAGNGQNVGITALGPGFAAVFNAGPAVWRGNLQSNGESHDLRIVPGRYALVRFVDQANDRQARISGSDVLNLDNLAFYTSSPVAVELRLADPHLERALLAVGVRFTSRAPQAIVATATPPERPGTVQTAYFADDYGDTVVVADVDPTDPLTRGLSLTGLSLHLPIPPPGEGWLALVRDDSGRPLLWRRGRDLYLPPLPDWKDQPALLVLLYNWLAPLHSKTFPLGTSGVLRPSRRGGKAYSLLSVTETNLPRPRPDRLAGAKKTVDLSAWLAVLAALLLVLAGRLKVPDENG